MKLRTLDEFIGNDLADDLRDPEFALGYVQACVVEGQAAGCMDVVGDAIHDVARANNIPSDEFITGLCRPRVDATEAI